MSFSENFISFEKAKLLKEKGVTIPSMFLYYADSTSSEEPFFIIYKDAENYNGDHLYNAYLSSEVINMLPPSLSKGSLKIIKSVRYTAMYTQRFIRHGSRLADTLVELLEFLLEKGRVTLKDINNDS